MVETKIEAPKAMVTDFRCFAYSGTDLPTLEQATSSTWYTTNDPACTDPVTLCKICFDVNQYPLNDAGLPDFEDQDELREIVEENYNVPAMNGVPITTPSQSTITLHFRDLQP